MKERVDTIGTEYAVFKIHDNRLNLVEKVEEIFMDELKKITPVDYQITEDLKYRNREKVI
ncbi:hypothetical protein [Oceanobacillus senegalensis]|uniref:hypothetical protein n=1 Tax=Oceanobacillus senegalensis TaxID=1936063 RepID=UPI00117BDF89|nr:hypothetical protein [Oceanobacillus senegalensis]